MLKHEILSTEGHFGSHSSYGYSIKSFIGAILHNIQDQFIGHFYWGVLVVSKVG